MIFRKKEFLQRNISRKDRGQAECVTGMFFLIMLCILMYTQLQTAAWHSAGFYLEDALADANLAAALIDIAEYGRTHKVLIADPTEAYRIYCDAVKKNLQLDEQWMCANREMIAGRVEIADFVVYNVEQETVSAYRVGSDGYVTDRRKGALGEVRAPNGIPVEHTGIYSEITFPVEGFPGIIVQAHKGKLVDIVSESREEEKDEGR